MDDVSYQVLTNAGEQREDNNIVIQPEMRLHGFAEVGLKDAFVVICDVDACVHQVWVVERFKSIKLVGTLLGGSVAAQQMTIEVDTHLRHSCMSEIILCCRYFHRCDEIFLAVGTQLSDGQL